MEKMDGQIHLFAALCRLDYPWQVYEFSLNISKGTVDSEVAYGLVRSDVATVKIEVIPMLLLN